MTVGRGNELSQWTRHSTRTYSSGRFAGVK